MNCKNNIKFYVYKNNVIIFGIKVYNYKNNQKMKEK